MERKEFKKIVNDCLLANGFLKKGKYYYKESPEVICCLGLQKSNYSNCYYVNVGIVIKEINNVLIYTVPAKESGNYFFLLICNFVLFNLLIYCKCTSPTHILLRGGRLLSGYVK